MKLSRMIFRKADHLLHHPEELLQILAQGLKKAYARRASLNLSDSNLNLRLSISIG